MTQSVEKIVSNILLPEIPQREFRVECAAGDDIFPAISAALENCRKAGGGRITLPPGTFRCNGPIHLVSHTELHLSAGTFLKFTPFPDAYLPQVFTRWEGVELYGLSPMIYADNITDAAITGSGVICGGWEEFTPWRLLQPPAAKRTRGFAELGIPVEQRVMRKEDFIRPSFVQFVRSERILLDGPTFTNTAFWMIHPVYCRHVTIRNIHLDSLVENNDGIDVESSEDVLIENSTFRNGDDAVVIKAGRDQDGLRVGRPTRRVVVRNCTFFEALHGFAIGSELSGGAEDIFVQDIVMKKIFYQAISFKSMPGRGGVIRNIRLNRITVDYAGDHLVNLTNDYGSDVHGTALTLFDDISVENLQCTFAKNAFAFIGKQECQVGKFLLKNVNVQRADVECSDFLYAPDVRLENVTVNSHPLDQLSAAAQK